MIRIAALPAALKLVALAMFAIACAAPAHAQKIRPGLWENSVAMKSSGGQVEAAMAQMQAQLASMPPEQRAQVEAMMANQGIGMAAGKPNTVRSCISPEMAARDQFDTGDGRCKSTGHTRSGNVVRFKFVCQPDASGAAGEGEGEFTLVSDTENRGKMRINATRQGQTLRMEMDTTSRWLGADCGTLKPVGGAAK
jgi:hypothetical protein